MAPRDDDQQEFPFGQPYRGWPPYVAGSETSFAAAEHIDPTVAVLRAQVLAALNVLGRATDERQQDYLGMPGNTQRPRRCELVEAGLVRDSGQKAKTRSGRMAVLWEPVPKNGHPPTTPPPPPF